MKGKLRPAERHGPAARLSCLQGRAWFMDGVCAENADFGALVCGCEISRLAKNKIRSHSGCPSDSVLQLNT